MRRFVSMNSMNSMNLMNKRRNEQHILVSFHLYINDLHQGVGEYINKTRHQVYIPLFTDLYSKSLLLSQQQSNKATTTSSNLYVSKAFFTSSSSPPRKNDYYKVLNVPKEATKKEIKLAYFRLAKRYHPDTNPDPIAKEKFQELAEAYTILSDDHKKQQYDASSYTGRYSQGSSSPSGGVYPPNINPNEVFKQIFEDLGVQDLLDRLENTKLDAIAAIDAAGTRGNWEPAKTFASNNKILIVGFLAPFVAFVRFPWMLGILLRGGTSLLSGLLVLAARNPQIAAIIGRAMYQHYMMRVAARKPKK